MTISLRTAVKSYVKDGQRQHDYKPKLKTGIPRKYGHIYSVEFWNKLLREGKMKAKNRKCNDQTLWNAMVRNYIYWERILREDSEMEEEKRIKLNKQLDLIEKFFNGAWEKEVVEYYKRQDPNQWFKLRFKVKAEREVPVAYYFRNHLEVPKDRVIGKTYWFAVEKDKWAEIEKETKIKRRAELKRLRELEEGEVDE